MPADIYSALMGQLPTDQESQQALINALRGKNAMGALGAMSGDPNLAPFGRNLMSSTDQEATRIGGLSEQQKQLASETAYRQSQEAHMSAQEEMAKSTLQQTIAHQKREDDMKMWALGIDPATGKKDPTFQKTIEQIGNLERPPLNASSTRNPRNFNVMEGVHDQFPGYHEDQYRNLQETTDAFSAKGKQGPLLKSADVGIHHLAAYEDQIDKLHSGPIKFINEGANWLKTQFGLSAAPNSLDTMKGVVSQEVEKFILGGGTGAGALADRQMLQKDLDS